MYIQPDSTIRLYTKMPIDNKYENTFYWGSISEQNAFFANPQPATTIQPALVHTLDRYSYIRSSANSVRVELPYSSCYYLNYMAFKNSAYLNKWFYAFITSVTYINDTVTEINFTLDVLQTWYFDIEFEKCIIEREHTPTDKIGDNIVEEELGTGDYVITEQYTRYNECDIVVSATFDATGADYSGGIAYPNGLFSGLCYIPFSVDYSDPETSISDVVNFLESFAYKVEKGGVINVTYVPKVLLETTPVPANYPKSITVDFDEMTLVGGNEYVQTPLVGNYTPRNRKLYTYPYNFISVTNNHGEFATYKYEFFAKNPNPTYDDEIQPVFEITGSIGGSPTLICIPKNYKQKMATTPEDSRNVIEKLTLSDYPMCAFNSDTYKAWLAQTFTPIGNYVAPVIRASEGVAKSALMADILGTSVSEAVSGAAPLVALTVLGAKAAELWAGNVEAEMMPNQAHSNQTGTANFVCNIQGFTFLRKTITEEYAKMIDDYFDMFGYACKEVKKPSLHNRTNWTYTKTLGCQVVGTLPVEDKTQIEGIFDNGIRYWVNPKAVGDYSLSNTPISVGGGT